MSDMAGKAAEGSGRAQRGLPRYNGATGARCEPHLWFMAGKAAEGSGRAQRGLPRYKEDQLPCDVDEAFTSSTASGRGRSLYVLNFLGTWTKSLRPQRNFTSDLASID